MTVTSQIARNDYQGNGVTTQFPVTFRFLDDTHLKVLRTVIATGATTTLTLNAAGANGYTVTGAQQPSGGIVTLNAAPAGSTPTPALQERLSILRNVPVTQETDYLPNDPFPAETHERALDKLTMIAQQQAEVTGRAIVLPAQSVGVSTELPGPVPLNLLRWNPTGTALENGTPPEIATVAPGSVVDATVSPIAGIQSSKISYSSGAAGSVARSLKQRLDETLSVKDYGAKGDGIVNDAVSINAAIDAAISLGVSTVRFPKGRYVIESSILIKAGIRLLGEIGSVIIQRDGANLVSLIEFGFPITADGASLEGLTIDGNGGNNNQLSTVFTVHVRTASRVLIKDCTFVNAPGWFIATNGPFTTVQNCVFQGCFMGCAFAFHANPAPTDAYFVFEDNLCLDMGGGSVLMQGSNYGVFRGNRIIGTSIGGRGARLNVNTSGTSVSWVSGPNFASIRPGMFVVLNNGAEFKVISKTSNTQLTVDPAMPTLSNVQASIGTGDLVGNLYSSFCQVIDNVLYGGVTFGCGGVVGGSSYQCSYNTWAGNQIVNSGKNAVNITYDGGAGFLDSNTVSGNHILNPGSGGGIGTSDRIGIYIASGVIGKVVNTFIDGNTVTSFAGDGQTEYWLGFDGNNREGSVFLGRNVKSDIAFPGIKNDAISIVLGAGWGSTASVSDISSNGTSISFRVTSSGSGIAAFADLAVYKVVGTSEQIPTISSKIVTSTGGVINTFGEQASTQGAWRCAVNGTPVSGIIYVFNMKE